jgi:hypothetical protein
MIMFNSIGWKIKYLNPILRISDADTTCKIPFFMNGIWYRNCTMYPRERYWCPTQVDPITRIQLSK